MHQDNTSKYNFLKRYDLISYTAFFFSLYNTEQVSISPHLKHMDVSNKMGNIRLHAFFETIFSVQKPETIFND